MFRGKSRVSSPRQLAKLARLSVELLEDRCLLSASPLDPHHLLITTTDGLLQKVAITDGTSVEDAIAGYQAADGVAAVDIDYQVSVTVIPNDTSFGSLFGMHNTGQSAGTVDADIDAPEAWDVTTGSLKTVVGIIDTGIDYRHRDLYLNIWLNPGEIPTALGVVDVTGATGTADGIITFIDLNHSSNSGRVTDFNANGYIDAGDLLVDTRWENGNDSDGNGFNDDLVGWDFVNNDNDPLDDNNHGTHVAGTIGAMGNNSLGVVGVNWNVQMVGLKFLSASGSGATSGAISALNYAVGKGIKISNNSWGGGGFSQALFDAINNARANGHIFVAAAGNANSNNDSVASYPSNYNVNNVIAVASTDRNDVRSSFSNFGATQVDLAAPGSAILSTTPNNTYSSFNGTSMATPHVAGAVALVWSQNPTLTYDQVIARILNNVDQKASLTGLVATGGRLNVFKALQAAPPADTQGPRVLSAVQLGTTTSVTGLRVTFSEAINASSFNAADVGITGPSTVSGIAVSGSGTVFDITFNAVTIAGTYSFTVGPNITDSAGNNMDQDNDGVIEATDSYAGTFAVSSSSTQTFTNTTLVNIVDRATVSSTIAINQDITIADLDVKLYITHTWDSDLRVRLRGPNGTLITLVQYRGGSGDNFGTSLTNTTFNDEAATAISAGTAPFAGSYRPEGTLTAFDNVNARGTWTLEVYDRARGDVGVLRSWSLVITGTASGASIAGEEDGSIGDLGPIAALPVTSPIVSAPSAAPSDVDNTNPFLLFAMSEDEEPTTVFVSAVLEESEETRTTATPDDARLRQEALDSIFGETIAYGSGGEDDGEFYEDEAEAEAEEE